MRDYIFNVLIAADCLLNAITGGHHSETVSARATRNADRHGWKQLGQILEWIDPGHLDRSARYHDKLRNK
ncbi:hypothetical protein [uncultured Maritalea sp.]|uniref:hypothetical protein n=1 Tax=uncultured Maritalea sp. TaxID=757249 RepID=UPI00260691AF|nr:hypothetical protein [uncultured Maritalea sp.]